MPSAAMREIPNLRQIAGESKRRWFSSSDFDLIVWFSEDDVIAGFELCYDKQHAEHSIAWRNGNEFRHMAVDDGEGRAGKHKASPVLGRVRIRFKERVAVQGR
jgi:hypothetical protein